MDLGYATTLSQSLLQAHGCQLQYAVIFSQSNVLIPISMQLIHLHFHPTFFPRLIVAYSHSRANPMVSRSFAFTEATSVTDGMSKHRQSHITLTITNNYLG